MPSWDRKIFEKENPSTDTETNSSPALLGTAQTVNEGPTNVYTIINTSAAESINLYDDDTIKLVVLPNTTLNLTFPVTFNNSLKVKNTGVSTVDYTIQYVTL